MTKKKVVLAYSGGLDTSVILKWLIEQDYEVVAYLADVGQQEDFTAAKEKALKVGASKVYIEDLKKEFVTDFIFPAFSANAVYEGRYLLGTSLARPIIAKRQIEIAEKEGAHFVGHGATGKGNDQVRFELGYYALNPQIKVLAPWKMQSFLDKFKGRSDMLAYADLHGIPVTATKKKSYSEDENLLHISHEAGILEDPAAICPEEVYSRTASLESAPDKADLIVMTFKNGQPVKVENKTDGTTVTEPLELFKYLNTLGSKHGIGRLDMVENRFVGIKSRGVYETPGGTILLNAHRDLEGITMDREVMRIRDGLSQKVAELIYNGFWFSPEMDFLMHAIRKSQENVEGDVTVKLFKGAAYPVARASAKTLYSSTLSSMDEEGGFNQRHSEGFIKINALRLEADFRLKKAAKP
ncbi:MAG: argininosuccinate synthase [Micavibrio sp.]|nr:argininosuccinate synthase [Micavibrio sp.]